MTTRPFYYNLTLASYATNHFKNGTPKKDFDILFVEKFLENPCNSAEFNEFISALKAGKTFGEAGSDEHSGWTLDIIYTINALVARHDSNELSLFFDIPVKEKKKETVQKSSGSHGTDIYELAETYGEADYYDIHTGYTYGIAAYNRAKRFGLPTPGILVYSESGECLGVARKM